MNTVNIKKASTLIDKLESLRAVMSLLARYEIEADATIRVQSSYPAFSIGLHKEEWLELFDSMEAIYIDQLDELGVQV